MSSSKLNKIFYENKTLPIKNPIYSQYNGQTIDAIIIEFKLNKNKTVLRGKTTLTLLKQIVDHSNKKIFGWAFATNQDGIDLDYITPTYKGRWRIETGFLVQDEARIKSKSKYMKIRFFCFVYEQVLQLLWTVLYKEDSSFKAFVIEMYEMGNERVARVERESARANG